MTDTIRLKNLIKNSGLKYLYVAKVLGITYQGLKNKIENKSDFTSREIDKLCTILNILDLDEKEKIFFKKK